MASVGDQSWIIYNLFICAPNVLWTSAHYTYTRCAPAKVTFCIIVIHLINSAKKTSRSTKIAPRHHCHCSTPSLSHPTLIGVLPHPTLGEHRAPPSTIIIVHSLTTQHRCSAQPCHCLTPTSLHQPKTPSLCQVYNYYSVAQVCQWPHTHAHSCRIVLFNVALAWVHQGGHEDNKESHERNEQKCVSHSSGAGSISRHDRGEQRVAASMIEALGLWLGQRQASSGGWA